VQTKDCFSHIENFKDCIGMVNNKIERFLKKALNKMFQMVGEKFTPEFVKQEAWYSKREWSRSQEQKFRRWFHDAARKDLKWSNALIQKEYSWFNLMWGWKRNDWEKDI